MRLAYSAKLIAAFLFFIFALQMTDLTCFYEDSLLNSSLSQGEHQLKTADSGDENGKDSSTNIIGDCQCVCHLKFSTSPSTLTSLYSVPGLPGIMIDQLPVQKLSSYIFHPPKFLL
jgi:hypothetical protein